MNENYEVLYEGPISIYFTKPMNMAEGEKQSIVLNGKLLNGGSEHSFSILDESGALFQFNFTNDIAFYVLHDWLNQQTEVIPPESN